MHSFSEPEIFRALDDVCQEVRQHDVGGMFQVQANAM